MTFFTTLLTRNSKSFHLLVKRNTAFKSALAIENLYPQSALQLTTPTKPTVSLSEKFSGYIPVEQLDITYSRSTGPGGQNVNKVNTKVDLRFHLQSASWIHDEIKAKLLEKYKTKMTKEGFLVFRSDLTRSQQLNLADCLSKVRECISAASYESPPVSEETVEKLRKRHERAVRERLNLKRQKSQIKSDRGSPNNIEL